MIIDILMNLVQNPRRYILLCPERKGLVLDRAEALNDIERKKKPEKTKRKQKKKIVAKKVANIVLQDEPFKPTHVLVR